MSNACSTTRARSGPPDGEAVHYFFNPFSREIFAEVLHDIVVSYHAAAAPALSDPDRAGGDRAHRTRAGCSSELELPLVERMQVQALSPYEIAVFLADLPARLASSLGLMVSAALALDTIAGRPHPEEPGQGRLEG